MVGIVCFLKYYIVCQAVSSNDFFFFLFDLENGLTIV